MKILIEVSARHIHISEDVLNALFGESYKLTKKKDLSQPGQFACEEKVEILGIRGKNLKLTVLGPIRDKAQAEVSLTDAKMLGIEVPVRESGDLEDSASCTIVGPKGNYFLKEGLIVSQRHLHITPEIAEKNHLKNGQIISVTVSHTGRETIFGDTIIRISEKFTPSFHIDTDEANAANCQNNEFGEVIF